MAQPSEPNTPPVAPTLTAAQVHRLLLTLRQAAYAVADEIGVAYGLERPCKRCQETARRARRTERVDGE